MTPRLRVGQRKLAGLDDDDFGGFTAVSGRFEAQCLSLKAAIRSRMSGCPPAEPVENAGYEKHRRNEPEQDREDPRGYTADRTVV